MPSHLVSTLLTGLGGIGTLYFMVISLYFLHYFSQYHICFGRKCKPFTYVSLFPPSLLLSMKVQDTLSFPWSFQHLSFFSLFRPLPSTSTVTYKLSNSLTSQFLLSPQFPNLSMTPLFGSWAPSTLTHWLAPIFHGPKPGRRSATPFRELKIRPLAVEL